MTAPVCTSLFVCWMDAHSGTAAWVQAVLTVFAVLFSGWQGTRSFRHQQKISKLQAIDALLAIADRANQLFNYIDTSMSPDILWTTATLDENALSEEFAAIEMALADINIKELPNFEAAKSFIQFQQAIGNVKKIFSPNSTGKLSYDAKGKFMSAKEIVKEAHEIFSQAKQKL